MHAHAQLADALLHFERRGAPDAADRPRLRAGRMETGELGNVLVRCPANSCNWSGARHLEFDNSAAAADVTVFAAALAADEARSLPAAGQGVG